MNVLRVRCRSRRILRPLRFFGCWISGLVGGICDALGGPGTLWKDGTMENTGSEPGSVPSWALAGL